MSIGCSQREQERSESETANIGKMVAWSRAGNREKLCEAAMSALNLAHRPENGDKYFLFVLLAETSSDKAKKYFKIVAASPVTYDYWESLPSIITGPDPSRIRENLKESLERRSWRGQPGFLIMMQHGTESQCGLSLRCLYP